MKRRRLQFESFERMMAEVEALAAGECVRCGSWDLGQVCEHLAVAFHGCIDGVDYVAPWYFRTLLRPLARLVLFTGRRMPAGIRVAGRLIPDAHPRGDAEVREAVLKLREAVARFIGHGGPFVAHPHLGRMTAAQWREFHLIHCAHHLGFLALVTS